jgi:hypothetical protein
MDENEQFDKYLSGLKPETRLEVELRETQNLEDAMRITQRFDTLKYGHKFGGQGLRSSRQNYRDGSSARSNNSSNSNNNSSNSGQPWKAKANQRNAPRYKDHRTLHSLNNTNNNNNTNQRRLQLSEQQKKDRKDRNACYNCGKTGHMARQCRSGKPRVNKIEEIDSDDEEEEDYDQEHQDQLHLIVEMECIDENGQIFSKTEDWDMLTPEDVKILQEEDGMITFNFHDLDTAFCPEDYSYEDEQTRAWNTVFLTQLKDKMEYQVNEARNYLEIPPPVCPASQAPTWIQNPAVQSPEPQIFVTSPKQWILWAENEIEQPHPISDSLDNWTESGSAYSDPEGMEYLSPPSSVASNLSIPDSLPDLVKSPPVVSAFDLPPFADPQPMLLTAPFNWNQGIGYSDLSLIYTDDIIELSNNMLLEE